MAARAAAKLRKEHPDTEVELERGRLLEISVQIDGEEAYSAGRLAYPLPRTVAAAVRERSQEA